MTNAVPIYEAKINLKQAKENRNRISFLEKVQIFKEENKDLYSDDELEDFFEAINNRDRSCPHYEEAAHLFDGIMEKVNE